MENALNYRKSDHPIDPLFLKRWSPRAMTGEKIEKKALMSLLEAARWAPSSSNHQPWRFLYGMRETPSFALFYDLLVPFNQKWCQNASALVLIISQLYFDSQKPDPTHSFTTGAAFENLALQGTCMNLVVHAMQGFDYEKAKKIMKIPEGYQVEAMVAIGKPASKETLPEEIKKREIPSSRKPLQELVCEGIFSL